MGISLSAARAVLLNTELLESLADQVLSDIVNDTSDPVFEAISVVHEHLSLEPPIWVEPSAETAEARCRQLEVLLAAALRRFVEPEEASSDDELGKGGRQLLTCILLSGEVIELPISDTCKVVEVKRRV